MHGIHLISNGRLTEQHMQLVSEQIAQINYIHLREKTKTAKEILEMIDFLLEAGVPAERIIINDRVDVASIKKCCGVQLAYHSIPVHDVKRSFPALRIGKSVHSLEEAITAEHNGADFLIYGHIFSSNSKPGLEPRGITALADVTKNVSIPVIAIGGITLQNMNQVQEVGASGVAIMSGVWDAEDPTEAIKCYRQVFDSRKEEQFE